MLITEQYRNLNKQMHAAPKAYGTGGFRWAGQVRELMNQKAITTVLDYGAGKRTLEQALGFGIANYDPAIEEISDPPEPAELVVCTDVLEHIEPECLDAVLDHIKSLATGGVFLSVATRAAKKSLPDGRNAHLIVETLEWWLPKLWTRWTITRFISQDDQFAVFGTTK